jgi:sulfite reductase beta subunit-like hemoprotein
MCPGVFRPWQADDGLLVRLRLVGGLISGSQLESLLTLSETYGDGAIHLTRRANLQVRGIAGDGCLPAEVVAAFEATGLLPARDHELVRNIMVSPQSGYAGGRVDLRSTAAELDRLLVGDPALARLPGRFLFVLDDGRGDLVQTHADLGLIALDSGRVQLRIGDSWGQVVSLADAPAALVDRARDFLAARGTGPEAAWHVRELPTSTFAVVDADSAVPAPSAPLAYGDVDGGLHHAVSDGLLTRASAERLVLAPTLVITPWRGIFVPSPKEHS